MRARPARAAVGVGLDRRIPVAAASNVCRRCTAATSARSARCDVVAGLLGDPPRSRAAYARRAWRDGWLLNLANRRDAAHAAALRSQRLSSLDESCGLVPERDRRILKFLSEELSGSPVARPPPRLPKPIRAAFPAAASAASASRFIRRLMSAMYSFVEHVAVAAAERRRRHRVGRRRRRRPRRGERVGAEARERRARRLLGDELDRLRRRHRRRRRRHRRPRGGAPSTS